MLVKKIKCWFDKFVCDGIRANPRSFNSVTFFLLDGIRVLLVLLHATLAVLLDWMKKAVIYLV